MNNYINKLSCCYKELRNYLSGPLVKDQIYHISIANRKDVDQAALTRLTRAARAFAKVLRGVSMR